MLWGSVYLYDFLLEKKLIDLETYNAFRVTSQELKGSFIVKNPASLWEYNFVHQWQKPNSISENEFDIETKIFEKSLNFTEILFSDFKPTIASELEAMGEISDPILKAEAQNIKKIEEDDRRFNTFFGDFGRHSVEKPLVKEVHEKINRNDPCHCGSGKKFKKCCLN